MDLKSGQKIIKVENFAKYEVFILVGLIMTIGTAIKLAGIMDFSSDWFWLLAGIGLVVEGAISLVKQRRFDNKYKIIEREN
jgi:hypothetical protein